MLFIISLLMVAGGAILRYAADTSLWSNINEDTVGAILLVLGTMGILYSWFVLMLAASISSIAKSTINKSQPLAPQQPRRVRGRRSY